MDYNLKFKEEKEDKGIGIHLFLQIQMKKQYKKHSVKYIRTKRGIIDKAVKILDDYIFLESKFFITEYGGSCTFIKKTDIVKHSPNLIDIIEERRLCEWNESM